MLFIFEGGRASARFWEEGLDIHSLFRGYYSVGEVLVMGWMMRNWGWVCYEYKLTR